MATRLDDLAIQALARRHIQWLKQSECPQLVMPRHPQRVVALIELINQGATRVAVYKEDVGWLITDSAYRRAATQNPPGCKTITARQASQALHKQWRALYQQLPPLYMCPYVNTAWDEVLLELCGFDPTLLSTWVANACALERTLPAQGVIDPDRKRWAPLKLTPECKKLLALLNRRVEFPVGYKVNLLPRHHAGLI